AQRRNGWAGWITLTTDQLLEKGVKRPNGGPMARQWEIPGCEPVEYAGKPPFDPYVMGAWLGDGDAVCRINNPDEEVWERISETFELGVEQPTAGSVSRTVLGLKARIPAELRECPTNSLWIPDEFKFASADDRLELLRGLMDTDGECNEHGSCIFNTISERLAADVVWLCRSLGGKARVQPTVKLPRYSDQTGAVLYGQPCYRATLTLSVAMFYVERKRQRQHMVQWRYLSRWIDAIEPIGEVECMCVSVAAADQLYLANDFIVTHNSTLVAWIIIWAISTCRDTRGVVTANTETQLKTKTWPELAKWHRLFIGRQFFRLEASGIFSREPGHERTWRIDVVPWSERNTE